MGSGACGLSSYIGNLNSPTRNQSHIPCVARQILNHWATREVPEVCDLICKHLEIFIYFSVIWVFFFLNWDIIDIHHCISFGLSLSFNVIPSHQNCCTISILWHLLTIGPLWFILVNVIHALGRDAYYLVGYSVLQIQF